MCFTINAFSYLAVLAALMGIRVVHKRRPRAATHPLADLAEGWRYAMGFLPVRRMLFTLGAVSFVDRPYTTLMPAIAVQTFNQGAELVGLFIGAVGLGAVISAVSLARRTTIRGLVKWIGIAAHRRGPGRHRLQLLAHGVGLGAADDDDGLRHVHDRRHAATRSCRASWTRTSAAA